MGGPSTKRAEVSTAPLPELEAPYQQFLQRFLQNPQQTYGQFQPTSALQQQLGQTFGQLLSGGMGDQQLQSAQRAVGALEPLFQRQLQTIREQAPSRFNTAFLGEQGRALQDFGALTGDILFRGSLADQQGFLSALGMGSQYALGQGGLQNAFMQQLLGQYGAAATGAPIIEQQGSRLGGAAQGALSGAATGATVGGPYGAAIGGGIGLLGGLFG